MEQVWGGTVGAVFVLWFIASAFHQVSPPWWMRVARLDVLRLLPRWNFFAPRPGQRDLHLVIRDVVDGVPGPWRQLETGTSALWCRWLVNPRRFRQKALIDLVNRLLSARRDVEEYAPGSHGEQLSSAYLSVLAWAQAQGADVRPCRRQFAVAATEGRGQQRSLRVLYVSGLHTLE